ncbi:hypothetical protein KY331_04255 [Candidatus Woesearchaeota archaeon]|nr:hypothetical protein [Candidatus Woesearchaeota archaeon]
MGLDKLREIRNSFEDPFVLDAVVRYVERRGGHSREVFFDEHHKPISRLMLEKDVLERAVDYLLANGILKRDDENPKFFRLGEHGKEYDEAAYRYAFDSGTPRWENLTLDQTREIVAKVSEMPKTYFEFYPLHIGPNMPNPQTHTLDEALRWGLEHVGVETRLEWPNEVKSLRVHLVRFSQAREDGKFQGYDGGVSTSLKGECIWIAPVEKQRELYTLKKQSADLVRGFYPAKQRK